MAARKSNRYQNRLKYDTEQYKYDLHQSVAPLSYVLNPLVYERCEQVRPVEPGLIASQGISHNMQRHIVDIETDLKGINRGHSRDFSNMYKPNCPKVKNTGNSGYPCGGGIVAGFENSQEKLKHLAPSKQFTEYTRYVNPPSTLKETGVNRFDILFYEPQDEQRWHQQCPVGINYRLIVKDNYRPRVPVLMNQKSAWPTGN